jgi:soluble lytic murein transglycosylase
VKKLLLFLFLGLALQAKTPSFKEIEVMPSSYAKDFYTWQLLQEKSTTKKEAIKAYLWSKRKNSKLRKAIRKKVGYIPQTPSTKTKKKKDPKNYIIYPATAAKKSKKSLKKLYKKIQKQGKYSETLHVMSSDDPFKELAYFPTTTQAYIFNHVGLKYLRANFNKVFSQEQLAKLAHEKQFNNSINKIVMNRNLPYLKASLLMMEENSLSFNSNFLLAINAIELKQKPLAVKFLKMARTKTTFQSLYDKVDFWLYLVTHDEAYLKQLLSSHQVNLYTLRARDILKQPYPKVVTLNLEYKHIENFDITNPIDWEKIKLKMKERSPEEIEKMAENYKSHATEGVYSYLKEKATKYTVPYYPMPYREAMWGYSKERVALLYALSRQESRFVPASVSPSYALGMMQIMPFLIKHLAKERKEKIQLEEMFNPYVAISYANQHLNYLNKWLYNPLFVAYAYNGGIGFTRGLLRKKYLFRKEGGYEPYLSMELIDNEEAREYGKKVLANYVIYLNLLGSQTKVSHFLNRLTHPDQTDRFRK